MQKLKKYITYLYVVIFSKKSIKNLAYPYLLDSGATVIAVTWPKL